MRRDRVIAPSIQRLGFEPESDAVTARFPRTSLSDPVAVSEAAAVLDAPPEESRDDPLPPSSGLAADVFDDVREALLDLLTEVADSGWPAAAPPPQADVPGASGAPGAPPDVPPRSAEPVDALERFNDTRQAALDLFAKLDAQGWPSGGVIPAAEVLNSQLSRELRDGEAGDIGALLDALAGGFDFLRALQRACLGGLVATAARAVGFPDDAALLAGRIVVSVVTLPFDASLLAVAISARAVGACLGLQLPGLDSRLEELAVTGLGEPPDRSYDLRLLLSGELAEAPQDDDIVAWLHEVGILGPTPLEACSPETWVVVGAAVDPLRALDDVRCLLLGPAIEGPEERRRPVPLVPPAPIVGPVAPPGGPRLDGPAPAADANESPSPASEAPWDAALPPPGEDPWDAAPPPPGEDPWDAAPPPPGEDPWDAALPLPDELWEVDRRFDPGRGHPDLGP